MGSIDFHTPGPKAFLQIVAKGPLNGGSTTSTIQWLGAYAGGNGRIAQIVGNTNGSNFDYFYGTDSQHPYQGLALQSIVRGDMNGDGGIDSTDFDLFAFGLMNKESAYGLKCNSSASRGSRAGTSAAMADWISTTSPNSSNTFRVSACRPLR